MTEAKRKMRAASRFAPLLVAAMLAACGSVPVNRDIETARAEVAAARSLPTVAHHAALELEQADQALRRAETAWEDERDEAQVSHLAYLARQRVQIARNLGNLRANEARIKEAGSERQRLRAEAATAASLSAQEQAAAAQNMAVEARQQARMESQRADSLRQELERLDARETGHGMVMTLPDVLFRSGQADLAGGASLAVDRLVALMGQYPELRLRIEGFTDSVGSVEMNMDLARRRAESFRNALVERGISPARLEVRAYGPAFPVADNSTPAGRMLNRRVEVVFSESSGVFPSRGR